MAGHLAGDGPRRPGGARLAAVRFVRRLVRSARRDDSARGWLLGALAASIASLAAGMFFFDALTFVQVALLLFIVMALGAVTLQTQPGRPHLTGV